MPSSIKWIGLGTVAERAYARLATRHPGIVNMPDLQSHLAEALAESFNFLFTFKRKVDDLESALASGGYGALSASGELTDLGNFYQALEQCYDPTWLSQFDVEGNPL